MHKHCLVRAQRLPKNATPHLHAIADAGLQRINLAQPVRQGLLLQAN